MGKVATKIQQSDFDFKAFAMKLKKPNHKYELEDEAEWFEFLHSETEPDKFIPFMFIPSDGNMRTITLSYRKKEITNEVLQTLSNNAYELKMNMYMSPASLFSYKRNSENAWAAYSIVLDLDYYETEYKDLTPGELLEKIDFGGCKPSMIACSGNGVYLVYKLSTVQKLGTPAAAALMRKVKEAMIAHFDKWGADSRCKDAARVFTAIGSRKFKNDTVKPSYIIDKNEKTYDILELLEAFEIAKPQRVLKTVPKPVKTTANTKSTPSAAFVPTSGYRFLNLAEDRLDDFERLLEMRGGYFGEGEKNEASCRNSFLHLVAVHCFYAMKDAITVWNTVEYFNSKLTAPLTNEDIDRIVSSANDNNENRVKCEEAAEALRVRLKAGETITKAEVDATKKFYRYKNTTIIDLLYVSEEESRSMKQLVCETVKRERRAAYDAKRYEKEKQDRAIAKEEKQDSELLRVSMMMNDHMTNEEMAQVMGCSVGKIKRLKKQVKEELAK